jgi:hypothetical protein
MKQEGNFLRGIKKYGAQIYLRQSDLPKSRLCSPSDKGQPLDIQTSWYTQHLPYQNKLQHSAQSQSLKASKLNFSIPCVMFCLSFFTLDDNLCSCESHLRKVLCLLFSAFDLFFFFKKNTSKEILPLLDWKGDRKKYWDSPLKCLSRRMMLAYNNFLIMTGLGFIR